MRTTTDKAKNLLSNPLQTMLISVCMGLYYTSIAHMIWVAVSLDILIRGQEEATSTALAHLGWGLIISLGIGVFGLISAHHHINK